MYRKYFKRFFDVIISIILLCVLFFPMIIIAILIKLDSPGPAIFKQKRLGKYGHEYTMLKFRTMCVGAEKDGVYSDDMDPRVSRVGKFLRSTSLDELPQLVNVIKGDMSLVGFRSPLTYHPWKWEKYTNEQKIMFNLRPGITGWAQVNGRKTVEWNERIKMNVWYAQNCTLKLDIKIILLTIVKVIKNDDNENIGETI